MTCLQCYRYHVALHNTCRAIDKSLIISIVRTQHSAPRTVPTQRAGAPSSLGGILCQAPNYTGGRNTLPSIFILLRDGFTEM